MHIYSHTKFKLSILSLLLHDVWGGHKNPRLRRGVVKVKVHLAEKIFICV